ncbi:MAG: DUF308 domain-containing protein, partial [Planctomycetota bacterium]
MSVKESPEAKLKRGETIKGSVGLFRSKDWEYDLKEFRMEGETPVPLKSITCVNHMDKVYSFWTDGIEPEMQLPATPEIRALARILEKHLKKRAAKGEDLSLKQESGRLLFDAFSSHRFLCIFLGILFLIFALVLVYDAIRRPEKASWLAIGAIIGLAVGLFGIASIKRPRLEAYENEIHKHAFFGGVTKIHYDDIVSFTTSVTKVKSQEGKSLKTKTSFKIEGPEKTIRFSDPNGDARKQLQSLEYFISEVLAVKFWRQLESGQDIPFGKQNMLTPAGLKIKDGSVI